jgi:hypothetical protein
MFRIVCQVRDIRPKQGVRSLELAHNNVVRAALDTASTSPLGANGFICAGGDALATLGDALASAWRMAELGCIASRGRIAR